MTKRTVYNKADNPADQLSLEEIEKLPVLFTVKNNWRQRNVVCHRHPHRTGGIISVGYSFDETTVTVGYETEKDWARELEELPWRQSFTYD